MTTRAVWKAPESACHQTKTCPNMMPLRGSLMRYSERYFIKAVLVPISKKVKITVKNCSTRPHMPSAWAEGRMKTGRTRFW